MFKQILEMNGVRGLAYPDPKTSLSEIVGAALSGPAFIAGRDLKVDSGTCRHLGCGRLA